MAVGGQKKETAHGSKCATMRSLRSAERRLKGGPRRIKADSIRPTAAGAGAAAAAPAATADVDSNAAAEVIDHWSVPNFG